MTKPLIPGTQMPVNDMAKKFKSLHVPGNPVILANVHDAITAQIVATLPSTAAVATASFSIAATQGVEDNELTLSQNLQGISNAAAGLSKARKADQIPLSADLQDGYDVENAVQQLIKLGVVGANIEDLDNSTSPETLRDVDDTSSRLRRALATAAEAGVPDFVVNARTDVLGYGGDIADCIKRGKKYLEAGATSVFVWGCKKRVITIEEVAEMCRAFDGRLAVHGPGVSPLSVADLRQAGVSRISVGPAVFRKAMKVFEDEASSLVTA